VLGRLAEAREGAAGRDTLPFFVTGCGLCRSRSQSNVTRPGAGAGRRREVEADAPPGTNACACTHDQMVAASGPPAGPALPTAVPSLVM
jgi:hypothetical protein